MAFSQSVKKGQIPVYCKLCETETQITCKCIECNLLMCTKCKNTIHQRIAKNHKVVDIKDVGDHIAEDNGELDFTNIKCHEHSSQVCFMFCKSCDQLVCPICISKVHNGHGLVEIKEGYEIQVEKLLMIENQVSKNLDQLHDKEIKIQKKLETEKSKYQDVKKRIQEQNAALKKAVDEYTNGLITKLHQNWTDLENSIKTQHLSDKKQHTVFTETKSKVQNLRKSNEPEKMFSEVRSLSTSTGTDDEPLELSKFDSMPVFIPGEISQYNFGQLQQTPSTAIYFDISQCFTTELGLVSHISVNPDDSIWINDGKQGLLQKVKPEGDKLSIISSYNVTVYGMALTPSNDILLTTGKSTLQMISDDGGKLKDTNYMVSFPCINCVHVTSQNEVMVGAWDEKTGEVTVLDIKGKNKIEYQHDRNGESLFRYPKRLTSTRNRNIFVIDRLSDDYKGRVVILQQTGDVCNIYRGHPDINDDKRLFKPQDMTCTPSDNVIVTALNLNIIHILNNTGYLIKYYNVRDIGIVYTYSLAFSRSGTLYIGCTRGKGSKENVKLYEVNISGI